MITIAPIAEKHYESLYRVHLDNELFAGQITGSSTKFKMIMSKSDGWVVLDGEKVIGAIILSDLFPLVDVTLHVVVDKEHRKKWLRKAIVREVLGYCFDKLKLVRVSGFSILDIGSNGESATPDGEKLLEALGFKEEGTKRSFLALPDGLHDVKFFGMLRGECRWI